MKVQKFFLAISLILLISSCAGSQNYVPKPDIYSMSNQELLVYAQNLHQQGKQTMRSYEDVQGGVYNSITLPIASIAASSLRHKIYEIEDEMGRVQSEMQKRRTLGASAK